MGKEALKEKRKILSHKQPEVNKPVLFLPGRWGWLLLVLHSESEKLLWLVGSINVLQEKDKQLSTELLMFMEKVERLSF